MHRGYLLALLLALGVGVLVFAFWPSGAPPVTPTFRQPTDVAPVGPAPTEQAPVDRAATARRVADGHGRREDDPEIRAALCGFRGRVLDAQQQPVPERGVRIYRIAQDAVLPPMQTGVASAPGEPSFEPRLVAGETRTAGDGTFLIGGVWPDGIYLLLAGIGTDAPSHRLLSHAPGPGEIVDLGDIVLDATAVLIGTVVDDDDRPVAGALVRAVDLPPLVLSALPIERLAPESILLLRDRGERRAMPMPAWAKTVWEQLPVPSTRTDANGAFRLVGVTPGSNLLVATHREHLSRALPAVAVEPGATRDVGPVRLDDGEEVTVRVLDQDGKPVAGAEVAAGTTSNSVPIDIAQRLGATDAEGRITGRGFGNRATAAARRSPRDPWLVVEPQTTRQEIVVHLPVQRTLTVKVVGPDQSPVADAELRLVERGSASWAMNALGIASSVELGDRAHRLDDGRWRIEGLPAADYVVLGSATGFAVGQGAAELRSADAEILLVLPRSRPMRFVVLAPGEVPVRNAQVHVLEVDAESVPHSAGVTDRDGVLTVALTEQAEVRVTVDHPKWGALNAEVPPDARDLVLRFQAPGWIDGLLRERGREPAVGKYSVQMESRWEPRGALQEKLLFALPDRTGAFAFRALQPGNYRVGVMPAVDSIRSAGGAMRFVQTSSLTDLPGSVEVSVVAGQATHAELTIGKDDYVGPTARLSGTAILDGNPAAGAHIRLWTAGGRRTAEVDRSGHFDCGDVPAGQVNVQLIEPDSGTLLFGGSSLFDEVIALKDGEARDLRIEVTTVTLRGVVTRADGTPCGGAQIHASGRALDGEVGEDGSRWAVTNADADGRFEFARVRTGIYALECSMDAEPRRLRARLENVRAAPGARLDGLRLELRPAIEVRGQLDRSAIHGSPEAVYVQFLKVDANNPKFTQGTWFVHVEDDGSFQSDDVVPGDYQFSIHLEGLPDAEDYTIPDRVTVPPQGLQGLALRVVRKAADSAQQPPANVRK